MILNPDAVRGLTRFYGHTGKRLWVYQDDTNDIELLPREPGDRPPKQHPQYPNYRRIGRLDLETGEIRRPQQKQQQRPKRDWLQLLYMLCKTFVVLCVGAVIFLFIVVAGAGGGGSRSTKRLH